MVHPPIGFTVLNLGVAVVVGCGLTSEPPPTPNIRATIQAAARATLPTPAPQRTPVAGSRAFSSLGTFSIFYDGLMVRVVEVMDGDTIGVEFPDGSRARIDILGIDAPDTGPREPFPSGHAGVTEESCLAGWGNRAATFARQTLDDQTVILLLDPRAKQRAPHSRLPAYINVRGMDFGAAMVERGYARVHADGEIRRLATYVRFQDEARRRGLGLWGCS